jgi:hypothetical protein
VWKQRAGTLAGSSVTLDFLEHGVLRAEWAEPRVHACLVCASLSCPNLRSEAFDARRLDAQLGDQARTWLTFARRPDASVGPLAHLSLVQASLQLSSESVLCYLLKRRYIKYDISIRLCLV